MNEPWHVAVPHLSKLFFFFFNRTSDWVFNTNIHWQHMKSTTNALNIPANVSVVQCQCDTNTNFAGHEEVSGGVQLKHTCDSLWLSEGPWEGIGLACLLYHPTELASLAVPIAALLLLAAIVSLPLQLKQLKQYNSHWGAASPSRRCVFVDNL